MVEAKKKPHNVEATKKSKQHVFGVVEANLHDSLKTGGVFRVGSKQQNKSAGHEERAVGAADVEAADLADLHTRDFCALEHCTHFLVAVDPPAKKFNFLGV